MPVSLLVGDVFEQGERVLHAQLLRDGFERCEVEARELFARFQMRENPRRRWIAYPRAYGQQVRVGPALRVEALAQSPSNHGRTVAYNWPLRNRYTLAYNSQVLKRELVMGAQTFRSFGDGAEIESAFERAVSDAKYEHGHGGYSGTIAEKGDYVVVQDSPLSVSDAEDIASRLIRDNDERITDKWGPAGAIRVRGVLDHGWGGPKNFDGWLFFGWASS